MRLRPQLSLIAALIAATSMWLYIQRILVPYQQADAARHERPRGNLSDLYPRWLGARELLIHHRDPYSPEITREVQMGYYGRVLDAQRPNDPRDQQAFAYPVYVIFLLAPTVHLSFSTVQVGFRWLLFLLTAASVLWWMRTGRWRPTLWTCMVCVLLTLGSYPAAQGIKLQQLSLLVSAMLAGAAALLSAGYLLLAGFLVAIATIKPQLAFPLAAWLTLWAASEMRQRWRLLAGLYVPLALLCVAGEYVLPGWIGRFRAAIAAYGQYTDSRSLLDVLLTPTIGKIVSVVIILAVAVVCLQRRRSPVDSYSFAFCLSLVLATTVVVIPTFAPYNQLLLLPAIFLAVHHRALLWKKPASRTVLTIAASLLAWPWLATVCLTIASFFAAPSALQTTWAVPLYTSLAIPLGVLAVLAFLVSPEQPLHLSPPGR